MITLPLYAWVAVWNNNKMLTVLALLDSGCTTTLITQEVAESLGLNCKMVQCRLTTFHGNDPKIPVSSSRCRVTPCGKETPSFNISRVLVVPKLKVADVYVDWPRLKRRWPHLRELDIPAIDTNRVGCFIGTNVPKALLQLENRTLSEEEPIGILTQFGWSVIGEIPITCMGERLENCQALSLREDKADEAIQELWTPEFFTSRAERQAYSNEQEKRALKILETTVRYLGDRYEIGLPWKSDDVYLPNNRASALRRLYATESRFQLDAEHGRRYTKAIEANMKNGFARRLTKTELEGPIGRTWYVPHFLVTPQNKPDKPRLVFDADSRHNGVSLNDALINGPSLLTDLHDLLVIFRERPCAVSMDIEKMFLQVRVKEEDQSAFRFLWRSPGSGGPPMEFQMMVEIFGASSSPTSCAFVLRQTGKDNPAYGDVSEKIITNFYVDNYLDSFDNVETAERTCHRLTELLKKGGFRLTHVMTSSMELWSSFPPEERAGPELNADLDGLPMERTLGLLWRGESDTFSFTLNVGQEATSKRQIASAVASIFDPLGILACVTIVSKIILQDVWRLGKDGRPGKEADWDDDLPECIRERWRAFTRTLKNLEELRVVRCLRPADFRPEETRFELHAFTDASERAYAAVVYLRSVCGKRIHVSHVTARSKVAPLKQQSIPRLELLGAVLGYRLAQRVKKTLRIEIAATTWWTDSTTVLHWLRSEATFYHAFVASRKEAILDGSKADQWRHVPGRKNPADDGTRGVQGDRLTVSHRWIAGPEFLRMDEEGWPKDCNMPPETGDLEEIHAMVNVIDVDSENQCLSEAKSLSSLVWAVADRRGRKPDTYDESEYKAAWIACVRSAQREYFRLEIAALEAGKPLPRSSPLLKLAPSIDREGILRVGGRLNNAALSYDATHPLILSNKGPFTQLIIADAHERVNHAKTERTLSEVLSKFWITKGRRAVRAFVERCSTCRRERSRPVQPFMSALPADRLRPFLPPFTHVGVDYFGPLFVVVGRHVEKRYGCLFTCMITRGVHIELSTKMDTDSFLMAYRRFVARRGTPKKIYSDNGTNFVAGKKELEQGAARIADQQEFSRRGQPISIHSATGDDLVAEESELREALDRMAKTAEINKKMAEEGVSWTFSPPLAPHFGEVWERLVRSAKTALRVVLRSQTVSEEVLITLLVEVEAMMNARPLTHLSVDPRDNSPITPNHFLLLRAHPHVPPDVFEYSGSLSRRRYLAAQELAESFWRRWLLEYVPALTERKKGWTEKRRNVQVGDVVLLIEKDTPRGEWPIGEVTEVIPSGTEGDDTVRAVRVRTKKGEYRRPVVKLCLLKTVEEKGLEQAVDGVTNQKDP